MSEDLYRCACGRFHVMLPGKGEPVTWSSARGEPLPEEHRGVTAFVRVDANQQAVPVKEPTFVLFEEHP